MIQSGYKNPKIGDVFEITVEDKFAYFQYTHKHKKYGHLVRVYPGLYKKQLKNVSELTKQTSRFWIFYPLRTAVNKDGLVRLVSNEPIPEIFQQFPIMRFRGGIDHHGKVLSWWLWDGIKEYKKILTDDDLSLSIRGIANHKYLQTLILDESYPRDVT